jgi:fatty acid desaturase
MNKRLDYLLLTLDDEIEKKCFEIKKKKAEQRLTRFFVLACILFLAVPVLLVFAGVNLLSICVPIVLFLAFAIFALSPIILNNNLGGSTR